MRTISGIGTTIYGRDKRQVLSIQERVQAEAAGFLPYSYQVLKWFVVLYFPVIPLGTYRVLKVKQRFWTMDYPRYRMTPVPWDWAQVFRHYAIAYGIPVVFVLWIAAAQH
jgi:hypothetical protein